MAEPGSAMAGAGVAGAGVAGLGTAGAGTAGTAGAGAVSERRKPGVVRDAIIAYLETLDGASASTGAIHHAVEQALGAPVAPSSVRSYLRLNPGTFARSARGQYSLRRS